ncbi:MAG: SUMF1/EgtB/PvdO family nonheme iron enzyme [Verrucomicrobiota bacterium]
MIVTPQLSMKKHALLIGINKYDHLGHLQFAKNDAHGIEACFAARYGFDASEITIMDCDSVAGLKPTRLNIDRQLDRLSELGELELVILGFWGHGILAEQGKRFLCAIDSNDTDIQVSGVSFTSVEEKLSRVQAKDKLLILDCCRSVSSGRSAAGRSMAHGEEEIFGDLVRSMSQSDEGSDQFNRSVAILNSCSEYEYAWEWGERKQGVFTAHLLDALENGSRGIAQIASEVRPLVTQTALKLHGKTQTPFMTMEGSGDFLLPFVSKQIREEESPAVESSFKPKEKKSAFGWVALVSVVASLVLGGSYYYLNYWGVFRLKIDPPHVAAKILIGDSEYSSVGSGLLKIKDLQQGEYRLKVVAPGYQNFDTRVRAGNAGSGSEECLLIPLWANVEIRTEPGTKIVAISEDHPDLGEIDLGETNQEGVLVVEDSRITEGSYKFVFENENFLGKELPGLRLGEGQNTTLNAPLVPLDGRMSFSSAVESVSILVNSVSIGETPLDDIPLPSGKELRIAASKGGYRPFEVIVTLDPNESRSLDLTLVPFSGSAEFNLQNAELDPSDMVFYFDGKSVGVSEVKSSRTMVFEGLIPSEVEVRIEHPNYEVWDSTVTIVDAESSRTEVLLVPKPAVLNLKVVPEDTDFKLTVNGEVPDQENQERILLDVGQPLDLRVSAPGFRPYELRREFAPNESFDLIVPLERYPVFEPGIDQVLSVPYAKKGIIMKWVEPGSFRMGSPEGEMGRQPDETLRDVEIQNGFWLSETEISQAQWGSIISENPSHHRGDDFPVESVSWGGAAEFCRVLNRIAREKGVMPEGYSIGLPSEEQWEFACRAGSVGAHAGVLEAMARFRTDSTATVGSKRPNEWGFYDMHGNVWEWCADSYASVFAGYRSIRGGGWQDDASFCRSAARDAHQEDFRSNQIGFRIAISLSD